MPTLGGKDTQTLPQNNNLFTNGRSIVSQYGILRSQKIFLIISVELRYCKRRYLFWSASCVLFVWYEPSARRTVRVRCWPWSPYNYL